MIVVWDNSTIAMVETLCDMADESMVRKGIIARQDRGAMLQESPHSSLPMLFQVPSAEAILETLWRKRDGLG